MKIIDRQTVDTPKNWEKSALLWPWIFQGGLLLLGLLFFLGRVGRYQTFRIATIQLPHKYRLFQLLKLLKKNGQQEIRDYCPRSSESEPVIQHLILELSLKSALNELDKSNNKDK